MQTYALVILNHLDAIERAQRDVRQLKYSLIASGEDWDYKKLFPEYDEKPKEGYRDLEEGEEIPDDAELDMSQVEWKSPSDDPEAFEKLMASINSRPGTFSGNDVVAPGEPTWSEWR